MNESRQGSYLDLGLKMDRVWLKDRHGFGHQKSGLGADFCSTPCARPPCGFLAPKTDLPHQIWTRDLLPLFAPTKPNLALEIGAKFLL